MKGTGRCRSITIKTPPSPRTIEACFRVLRLMMSWEGSLSQCSSLNSELEILNYWLKDIMKNTKEAHQEANAEALNVEYPFHKDDGYDFDDAVEEGCRLLSNVEGACDYDDDDDDEEEEEEEEVDPATSRSRGLVQGKELVRQFNAEEFRWSSVNGREETKGRYLCVSNGFEIWCLDLKQSWRSQDPVPLPKIATLNLLGEQLPAAVGLFKLGSDVYMIGGHDVPTSLKEPLDVLSKLTWGEYPSRLGINRYKILCNSWGIKGSSSVAYRLSLAEDSTLSPSEAYKIKGLNNPKVWPIVEQINGQLHVVDSVPCHLMSCCDWSFSHEVCNLDDGGGWEDISTIEAKGGVHINSHVVVGDRIYAVAYEGGCKQRYIEFDSHTRIWKRSPIKPEYLTAFNMKRVWNIIAIGNGRCVGEFPCGGDGGERVFVLIAIVKDYDRPNSVVGTQAVAYLVTSTGLVLCYQPLPDFFKDRSLNPCFMIAGTMIHVDDGEEGPTWTMCSVVSGTVLKDG